MPLPKSRTRTMLTAAVLCSAVVTGCSSPEQRRERAMARGSEYFAENNYEKAGVEFRNALQAAPNDPEARYQSGRVAERLGNLRGAAQAYQGAIDVQPDHAAARADLARLLLFGGAVDRALELTRTGLEKHPDDVPLRIVHAAASARMGDSAGALADAERAFKAAPGNENAIAVLAGLYVAAQRGAEARTLLENGLKAVPGSADLRLALATMYANQGEAVDAAKAEALLRDVVRLRPTERAHRLNLAQYLLRAKRPAEAETALKEALAALPKDRDLKLAYVGFVQAQRGQAAALAEFERFVAAEPGDVDLRFALGQFFEQSKEPARAEDVYRKVIEEFGTKGSGLAARSRLAALRAVQGDAAGAGKLVDEVLAVNPRDADALILRGNLQLVRGDAKGAIADLRSVLRDQPNATGVMRALARAHVANNETALAEETLRRGLDTNPADRGLRGDLAQLLLTGGKPEQAKPLLQQLIKEQPDDAGAQEGVFRAAVATRDVATARAAAEALVATRPAEPIGYFYTGNLAEAEGRSDDALRQYDKALSLRPDAFEPLQAIVRVLVNNRQSARAHARLEESALRAPTSPLVPNLAGELYLTEGNLDAAERSFRTAVERGPKLWTPYRGLAFVATQRGRVPEAERILRDAVLKVSEPAPLRMQLAMLLESAGRVDDAIGEYESLLKVGANTDAVANNLAMLLVDRRGDAASVRRAEELAKRLADSPNPRFLDTAGWVRAKAGDAAGAVTLLERASRALPGEPVIRYHLGIAQLAAGNRAAARESLKAALATGNFPGREAASAALAQAGREPAGS